MAYSDALDRETAWLTTVDTLPSLLTVNGGPFQVVQARYPRTPAKMKTALYVTRYPGSSMQGERFAIGRTLQTHHLRLIAEWPITSGQGSAEADQLAFDEAIDLILTRVYGPLGDKTHGGRFLSVAENPAPGVVNVDADDPIRAIAAGRFTTRIDYHADDTELTV